MTHIVHVKCIAHAFLSSSALQYFPGYEYDIDLADKEQRKLAWLRTPRGKWIFEFDRANSSNTAARIFFCAECGRPFDKLNEIGTHTRQEHKNTKALVDKTQADNEAEEEERLIAKRLEEEQLAEQGQVGA